MPDILGFHTPSIPQQEPIGKDDLLNARCKRVREITILLFECRDVHHVSECRYCDYWSAGSEHFSECSCKDEQTELRNLSHIMKQDLKLSDIGLPAKIYTQMFPDR